MYETANVSFQFIRYIQIFGLCQLRKFGFLPYLLSDSRTLGPLVSVIKALSCHKHDMCIAFLRNLWEFLLHSSFSQP